MGKCCWDSCHLMTDSKSLLAEKIAQIIKEKPISSLEMDTIKNPIGKKIGVHYLLLKNMK